MKIKLLFLLFFASLSSFAQSGNVPTYVPLNGLLAYYPFIGNANDVSINANNGIATDVTSTSDRFGNSNSAYSFNGTSSNIEANITNYPLKGGSRTITGWFKAASPIVSNEFDFCLLNYGNITDPNYWFKISFYRKGYLDIQFDAKTVSSQENYFNNQWTFFALTFDSATNTYSLYINNVYKMGGSASLYTNGFGNLFRIGRNKLNNYFEGSIDDIGVWNRVLTSEEISGLYNSKSTYTLIPDTNFEKKLIALGIDSGVADGKVLTSSVSSLTSLDVSSSSISNLTGIQDFVALTFLYCGSNQLVNLDVFKNTALTYLDCSNNQDLTTLDISKNNNVSLLTLNCYNNKLTALDVSKNTALTNLNCSSSQLTTLDVSKNTALTNLVCSGNQLSEIDLSNNVALDTLRCGSNKLIRLDVSKNINLKKLSCYNNKLESLNLKNGNNVNFENNNSYNISYKNNPSLTCIQVDDKTYSDANWSDFKDATASYSENCPPPYIIVSSEFEDKLIALGLDTDGKNGSVLFANIANVKSIDVSSSGITNLSGIEYFTDLETLICKGNSLTTINLSSNTALKYLDCSNNPLTALDVSKNILLTELYCDGAVTIINKMSNAKTSAPAQLTVLDLSNNLFLTKLSCSNNKLTSLDVSKNTLLTDINCSNNSLQNLNVSNGNNTKMLNVNFKSNSSLSCIKVDDAVYSNTNWAGAKDATAIYSKTACTLGIEDVVSDKISVYPNPVKGQLHIDNIVLEKVTVYDALGKLVKTTNFSNASDSNTLDLGGLTKGVYFIYLQSEVANSTRKIIVE
jgi:Leucine-rich repeat (LRR) protein